jgi:4-oxalocrotonate tautomerase
MAGPCPYHPGFRSIQETAMPHVVVKHFPGPTEEQKARLAEKIAQDVIAVFGSKDKSVSVALEEVSPDAWMAQVYDREIAPNFDTMHRKPGYGRG